MKQRLILLLSLLLSVAAARAWDFAYEYEGQNLYFDFTDVDGECALASTEGYVFVDEFTLPSVVTYGGREYTVTSVKPYVVCSHSLINVIIPASITNISGSAFHGNNNLETVTFEGTEIPNIVNAFCYCPSLFAFYGPNVSDDHRCIIVNGHLVAFASSGLTSYSLPETVTHINSYAFVGANLENLVLPKSLKSTGHSIFENCNNLQSLTINVTDPSTIQSDADIFLDFGNYDTCTLYVPAGSVDLYRASECWGRFANIVEKENTEPIEGQNACVKDGIVYEIDLVNGYASVCHQIAYNNNVWDDICGEVAITDNVAYQGRNYPVRKINQQAFYACYNMTDITIPSSVDELVNWGAFQHCNNLQHVNFSSGLEKIGTGTFFDVNALTEVELPETLVEIGDVFNGNTSIKTVKSNAATPPVYNGDEGWETVFDFAHAVLYVPEGSVNRYRSAEYWKRFGAIRALTFTRNGNTYKVVAADRVELINGICDSNGYAYVPATVVSDGITYQVAGIGVNAFWGNRDLKNIEIAEGPEYIEFCGFYGCEGLVTVRLPNSIKYIKRAAFHSCTNLVTAYLGNNVQELEMDIFNDCQSMRRLFISTVDAPVCGGHSALDILDMYVVVPDEARQNYHKAWFETGIFPYFLSIPDFEVDGLAFNHLEGNAVELASGPYYKGDITVPATVTYRGVEYTVTQLDECVFSRTGVTGLRLPETITQIGPYAFGSPYLRTLHIPNSVTFIDGHSLTGDNLETIVFGSGLTNLGDCAIRFDGLPKIKEITVKAKTPPSISLLWDDVKNIPDDVTLYVPLGTTEAYQNAEMLWGTAKNIVEVDFDNQTFTSGGINYKKITDTTVEVSDNHEYQGTSVNIPARVTYDGQSYDVTAIGYCAFHSCENLTSVTLPSSITYISTQAFWGTSLTEITIPANAYVVANAFANIKTLEGIGVDSSNINVESVDGVLYTHGKTELLCYPAGRQGISYEVPEGVRVIRFGAFYGNPNLAVVTLPSTLDQDGFMEYDVFECTNISDIYCKATTPSDFPYDNSRFLPEGISDVMFLHVPYGSQDAYRQHKEWGRIRNIHSDFEANGIWYNQLSDNTVEVTYNGSHEYGTPAYIGEIVIPAKVTNEGSEYDVVGIGYGAFKHCPELTKVHIPTSVTYIADEAFGWAEGLTSLVLPKSVKSIGNNCMVWSGLRSFTSYAQTPPTYDVEIGLSLADMALYVPENSRQLYKSANIWKDFGNVTSIQTRWESDFGTLAEANGSMTIPNIVPGDKVGVVYLSGDVDCATVAKESSEHILIATNNTDMIKDIELTTINGADVKLVVIGDIPSDNITISKSTLSLTEGYSEQIVAMYADTEISDRPVVEWSTSDETIATVDATGMVKAVKEGSVTITATSILGGTAVCAVEVAKPQEVEYVKQDNELALVDQEVSNGILTYIPVYMNNLDEIISFQCDIVIPDGVSVAKTRASYDIQAGDRFNKHQLLSNDVNGVIRVLSFAMPASEYSGDEGVLFSIPVRVDEAAIDADQVIIRLTNITLVKSDNSLVSPSDCTAKLKLKETGQTEFTVGDVNGDGSINIGDISMTVEFVFGHEPANGIRQAADINGDGQINIGDISALVNIIFNVN